MFAYSKHISRRFRLGHSVGPAFPNANSIMQGCPLAILRINCLIAAWARSVQHHPPTALCSIGAFIDDKNARTNSLDQLQETINFTADFDDRIDAIVNPDKTVVFATTTSGRKQLTDVNLRGQQIKQVPDDRLLCGQFSFTKRRPRFLANSRAKNYITTAERISICPLNIATRENLLVVAGTAKYNFGLELGPCDKKIEK